MFCIGLVNIDNIPPYPNDTYDEHLCREIHKYELDVLLLQEVGVNWSMVHRKQQLRARISPYFEPGSTRLRLGHNENDPTGSVRQWGGTGVDFSLVGTISQHLSLTPSILHVIYNDNT